MIPGRSSEPTGIAGFYGSREKEASGRVHSRSRHADRKIFEVGRPGRIGPTGWWEKSIWIIRQTLVDQEDSNDYLAHFQLDLKETKKECSQSSCISAFAPNPRLSEEAPLLHKKRRAEARLLKIEG